ncbi:unnamed protein product [Cuscuta campestris]|uniref:Uncharacterized protein n=1 Tax=Cuscuta campestris TaxID=132261 RepID=A0A484KXP2_9ASTE|nr:unnamed protein product [Cuscuta campestris]
MAAVWICPIEGGSRESQGTHFLLRQCFVGIVGDGGAPAAAALTPAPAAAHSSSPKNPGDTPLISFC